LSAAVRGTATDRLSPLVEENFRMLTPPRRAAVQPQTGGPAVGPTLAALGTKHS
jgi:hypothetical protein